MVTRIAQGRKEREIDPAAAALRACLAEAHGDARISPVAMKRLTEMGRFVETVERWYDQMIAVPAPKIMALMRMGAKVANFLSFGRKDGDGRAAKAAEAETNDGGAGAARGGDHPLSRRRVPARRRRLATCASARWSARRPGRACPRRCARASASASRGCAAVVYVGEVVECRLSAAGWLLAQLGRLIGAPLPLSRDIEVPACVSVTEDISFAGQFWTRIYGRRRGFPQVISSSKRFAGPTGLEEQIGGGFGIALRGRGRGRRAPFPQRSLFPDGARAPVAAAGIPVARRAQGQPCRLQSRPVRLRAGAQASLAGRARSPDGDV